VHLLGFIIRKDDSLQSLCSCLLKTEDAAGRASCTVLTRRKHARRWCLTSRKRLLERSRRRWNKNNKLVAKWDLRIMGTFFWLRKRAGGALW
jgi:hypothetical protein